jgi:AcrR family transcriptional regulator
MPMPRVSKEHRQARHDQILNAALECFAKKGFHRTSMRDIFSKAGLSAGAVYLHFFCKEDIIEECWKKIREARITHNKKIGQTWSKEKLLHELFDNYEKRINRAEADLYWVLYIQLLAEAQRNPRIKKGILESWDDARSRDTELLCRIVNGGMNNTVIDFDIIVHLWQAVRFGLIILKTIEPEKDVKKYLEAFEESIRTMLSDSKTTTRVKVGKRIAAAMAEN